MSPTCRIPADLVRRLSEGNSARGIRPASPSRANGDGGRGAPASAPRLQTQQQIAPQPAQHIAPTSVPQASLPQPQSFGDVVALFHAKREGILAAHLQSDVHLVQFEVGRIDFRPGERAPSNLPNRVAACLAEWTGKRWLVSVSAQTGENDPEGAGRGPGAGATRGGGAPSADPGRARKHFRARPSTRCASLAPEPAAEATVTPQGDVPPADEPTEDEIA